MMFLKNKVEPSNTNFIPSSLKNEERKTVFPFSGLKSPDFRATLQELLPGRYGKEVQNKINVINSCIRKTIKKSFG